MCGNLKLVARLLRTFNILSEQKTPYQELSKINTSKTEGMWVGSLRYNVSKPFGIKWSGEPIKALGVYNSYDAKLLHEKNFIERLDSVKKLVSIWSSRVYISMERNG